MRTAVTVRSRSRGSFAWRRRSAASSACTRWATRSGRRSATAPSSIVEELEALLAHLGELEPVDEVDDSPQAAVHVRLVRADLAHAEGRALPVIVVGALRDRDVELVLHARLDGPQHAALALERVILGEQQLEPEHADHHRYPSRTLAAPAPRASGRALGRLRALGRGGWEPAGHLLHLVGLDHVAHLHVLVALERHAALVAARHLARILFEALETRDPPIVRSEEHTSELQSPYDLVCRLLLDKKKSTTACMRSAVKSKIA